MESNFIMKPSLRSYRIFLLFLLFSFLCSLHLQAQNFRAVWNSPADNSALTTATVTVIPPGTISTGDLVIIYAQFRGASTLTISNQAATGQTWYTETAVNGTSSQSFAIFWCEYNGSWSANPIVSGGTNGTPITVLMYAFQPSNVSKVWGIHKSASNSSTNTTTSTITGLSTTVPNTVTMAFWGSSDDNTWGTLTGSGWSKTGLTAQYRNNSTNDQSHTAAYNIQASAATLPDVSQTQLTNGADFTRTSIISWAEFSAPPANDLCANAVALTTSTTCSYTSGYLAGATYTSLGASLGCGTANNDVWYSFVANTANPLITLDSYPNNATIQLFSGSCGSLTSLQCGAAPSITASGLTNGDTYYIRVYSTSNTPGSFNICITDPTPAVVEYAKSYANITKINGGGTISPGDTLEIRGNMVVKTLALDSIAFIDTLHSGLNFVPGSIAVRTNEGKIYRWDSPTKVAYTDAFDTDPGYIYTSGGGDSIIRINIGKGATGTARGKIRQDTRPSIGSGASAISIIMATYRVVVDTSYGSTINLGGGYFTVKDSATGVLSNISFPSRSAIVYETPGLCPNALSPVNAISDEYGGTFGSPLSNAVPFTNSLTGRLYKNRFASSSVPSYTDTVFSTSTPQDYFYGITNNTTGGWTTVSNLDKKDNGSYRVHSLWDITGDHTGATNTAKGNPPCDTTQPAGPNNPCGYMLVVNSSYKTDTAFQYNINNLCPNTYYEISFWVRNMCSKCGADSTGKTTYNIAANNHTAGVYYPFDVNDSSGVQPSLAIDINGIDYYTTGQIRYNGTNLHQRIQDTSNIWVKRGFTYLTSSTPGTLTMSIRNTAPGGGGNDWALDDISVVTCYPNMSYSPSLVPNVCEANSLTLYDTVRSYFNNYTHYKWQRSTDGGTNWTDVTAAFGPVTPTWNGSVYEYVSQYTVPPGATGPLNNGDKYRLITATSSSNLSTNDCISTDAASIVTMNIIDCTPVLNTTLISFNGRLVNNNQAVLSWVTSKEDESLTYIIEKSFDQNNFSETGRIDSYNNPASEKNYYSFTDPENITRKVWYRVAMKNIDGKRQYSRIISLNNTQADFGLGNVINPFSDRLYFDITTKENTKIEVILINMAGTPVMKKSYLIYAGTNSLSLDNTTALAQGIYTLKIESKEASISKRVAKRN